jgi:hypothetical protein
MSWPIRAECPRCFGITSWYARYARPENRCACPTDAELDEAELLAPVIRDVAPDNGNPRIAA